MYEISRRIEAIANVSARKKGIDQRIPLSRVALDTSLDFLTYNPANYDQVLQRAQHTRIFLRDASLFNPTGDYNYSTIPKGVAFDSHHTLLLYTDFGDGLSHADDRVPALAMSGFRPYNTLAIIEKDGKSKPTTGITLDIEQFQTARFFTKEEFDHFLGYIRYKELFMHIVEQLALHLQHAYDLPIQYVSLRERMENDRAIAIAHVNGARTYENVQKQRMRQLNELAKQARERGYNHTLLIAANHEDGHASYAKKIDEITPDISLQTHLNRIV